MEEILKDLEQPQIQIENSQGEEISQQNNGAEVQGDLGSKLKKFKDVDALVSAYNNLQSDYTKKCQALSSLQKRVNEQASPQQNLQELQTIKHYNLPIKLFVLNNNGYISIQQTQKNFFEGRMTACTVNSGVSIPDFIKIGKAFEIETVKIDKLDNLEEQIKNVLNSSGPILCEVMLSPDYIFAPKLSAKKLDDGTMISPSLEDLYPFLDRDEFEGNVI